MGEPDKRDREITELRTQLKEVKEQGRGAAEAGAAEDAGLPEGVQAELKALRGKIAHARGLPMAQRWVFDAQGGHAAVLARLESERDGLIKRQLETKRIKDQHTSAQLFVERTEAWVQSEHKKAAALAKELEELQERVAAQNLVV